METEVAGLREQLDRLKQAQIQADSLDETHASMFSDGGLGEDSMLGMHDEMLELSPVAAGTGSPAKSGEKRARATPLSDRSNNKRDRVEGSPAPLKV